jgi:hypothetical protein
MPIAASCLQTLAHNSHRVTKSFVPKQAVAPYVVSLSEFTIHRVAPNLGLGLHDFHRLGRLRDLGLEFGATC